MAMGLSTPPSKQRRTTEPKVSSGIDLVIKSATNSDIKYITHTLTSEGSGLTSFVASMLRDGEVQKALQRKKDSARKTKLGRRLAGRAKKLRHLLAKFCKDFVLSLLQGRDPFEGNEGHQDNEPKCWTEKLADSLRVTLDTELPSTHDYPRYEGSLQLVLAARAKGVDATKRLQGLTAANFKTFGVYEVSAENKRVVTPRFDRSRRIELLCWPAEYFTDETEVTISHNDSIFEAVAHIEPLGGSQALYSLFRAQHSGKGPEPDNEGFEYPGATKCFADRNGGSPPSPAARSLSQTSPAASPSLGSLVEGEPEAIVANSE